MLEIKGITLHQAMDDDLPLIWGNYDLLLQVLTNLIGNALKFTPTGGSVTLRAQKVRQASSNKTFIRVAIQDTGIGIDYEDQIHIFDRFFRAENRVHTLEGTGLGLSIVRNILEKHHTQISLESAPSVGTTFWFDLHVYNEESEPDFCWLA